MVYVIVGDVSPKKVLLVKAVNQDEVKKRLHLDESEHILGSFTDNEISALTSASFAIISS